MAPSDPLPKVPTVHFDTEFIDPDRRYDAWQENLGVLFDMSPPDGSTPSPDIKAKIDACNLGGAVFGTTRSQTQLFKRDASRVARDDMDHILVQAFLEGGGIATGDQKIRAGDMLIIDLDQPHEMLNTDFENLTMVLPRELIPGLSELLSPWHGKRLGSDSPMVRFVFDHMVSLWRHVPEMTPDQAASALEGTIGVLNGWLSREQPLVDEAVPAVSTAVRKAICRHIDLNLAEPLTPISLAAAFRVSRSQIYRMFVQDGGVARYVLERRLRRSLRMVTQPMFWRMSIGAVGFACGFTSESQFSKSFRNRYGISPSEARAEGLAAMPNGSFDERGGGEPPEFNVWIKSLGRSN